MKALINFWFAGILWSTFVCPNASISNKSALSKESNLMTFLSTVFEPRALKIYNNHVIKEWQHSLDLNNKQKEEEKINATLEVAEFDTDFWQRYFRNLIPSEYQNINIKRQVLKLKELGKAALNRNQFLELSNAETFMINTYSTAKICPFLKQNCSIETEGLRLIPDIEALLASSTNYDELLYLWKSWRDATGRKIKNTFERYVELSNAVAKINNFTDKGAMWRNKFESPTFEDDLNKLWKEVKPLYDELHKYVLRKLKLKYGGALDAEDGLIPAHLLGNMWAQSWITIKDLVKPFPDAPQINVTQALEVNGYTPLKMFQTADEFYQSLGLDPCNMSYNATAGAVIERPTNRDMICHASAWDFHDGKDFRIKMCTRVTYQDFITIHHEMGHIQYYMLYRNLPVVLRTGANPGFHEAVGDTIALSVSTPKHLKRIGLLPDKQLLTRSTVLNALMDMALERIAFLPFSFLVDKWRWDVFSGKVTRAKWNSHWWHYRNIIQKIKPPISRSDMFDFDPGSKFHIPADTQYISYFVAHILEFQFHKALCIVSGQYEPANELLPLHECDIYGSKKAGEQLRAGLSLGASRHWKVVLEKITGESELSGSAIMEYFSPLYEFLKSENNHNSSQ